MERKRILTGDRPTGRLHLGHYVGSLRNRVRLQDEYECYFIIADLHMLTTKNSREDIDGTADNARGMVLDYLSAGIDPAKSTIFLQSAVHETYELALIFGNLVTVPRLARLPSIKDMARAALLDEETIPLGLLGYPVLQAADILLPRAPTWSRSARTTRRTSRSPARSRAASITCTARSSRSPTTWWRGTRCPAPTVRAR